MSVSGLEGREISIRTFGSLELHSQDAVFEIPSGTKLRSVWAALVIDPGSTVSMETVAEIVWGAKQPKRSRESVHVYISQLRAFLDSCGEFPGLIETRSGGYRLAVDKLDVDWCAFDEAMKTARPKARAGDLDGAWKDFESALALYRGPFLSGLSDSPQLEAAVNEMNELYLACLEQRNEVMLARGDVAPLIRELLKLTRQFPVRETMHRQLMRALYLSERQIEALEVYNRLRHTLQGDYGVEPGRQVRNVHQSILERDCDAIREMIFV
ncbi:AfsR/SARP family transcriptional regulator [Rhodococcus sp. I2R]|uniref:AfsR/SARP family transcriptional regulator n=1 Tax=Rhodococcus sp. I2R TaxID=2855445 RepID=UPI001E36DB5D|nr:AfsR/SARP family transcriptional regulator [Rhodococcus sp. I2R]MCC8930186.1 AfsR/SARP family transcriptional regulator [Rhodococcus sp. I2R]